MGPHTVVSSVSEPLRLPVLLRSAQRWDFPHKLGVCELLYGGSIKQRGIAWVKTAAGPVWKLDLGNVTHRWIIYGYYEGPGFWRWLNQQRDMINIFDCGANIGQTTLHFAGLRGAHIWAYEPGSEANQWLHECIEANGLRNITVKSNALGSSPGVVRLESVGPPHLRGSWNRVSNDNISPRIDVNTIDNEMELIGLTHLDLCKVDVEGYELLVLEGARKSLAAHRIRNLYIELSPETADSCTALLRGYGYTLHLINNDGSLSPWKNQAWGNALCIVIE